MRRKFSRHEFVADVPHPQTLVVIAQQVKDPVCGARGGMDEKTGLIIVDLQGDAPQGAADDGFSFPQGFGHGKTKSLLQRFLQHDHRRPLQGIDLAVRVRRQ